MAQYDYLQNPYKPSENSNLIDYQKIIPPKLFRLVLYKQQFNKLEC